MRPTHRITLAVALAVSAVAGTAAATQTVHLGADSTEAPRLSASALAAQKATLAAADRSIDTALAARPPALPKVPRFAPLGEPSVPPVVVTRVVPVASSAATAGADDGAGDTPERASGTHPARTAAPAPPATSRAAAPAPAPVNADREEGEDRESSHDGEDEDHAEDRGREDRSQEPAEPEHGDED